MSSVSCFRLHLLKSGIFLITEWAIPGVITYAAFFVRATFAVTASSGSTSLRQYSLTWAISWVEYQIAVCPSQSPNFCRDRARNTYAERLSDPNIGATAGRAVFNSAIENTPFSPVY